MSCIHCGSTETLYRRGPLVAIGDPARIYHAGRQMKLPRFQAQALALLIRHGRVSHERMANISRSKSANSVSVNLCQLRQELPAGIGIHAVMGCGYVLDVGDRAAEPGTTT